MGTERALVDGRVRELDGLGASVLDALAEAVVCIDAAGTIVGAWGACFEILGAHHDELVGSNAYERVHPDDIAYAAGALAEAITRIDVHIPINLRIRTADRRWVLTEAAAGHLDRPELLLISLRPLSYRGHMDERRADLARRCLHIASTVAAAHGDQLERALVAAVVSINEFFHTAAVRFTAPDAVCLGVGEFVDWPEPAAIEPGGFRDRGRRGGYSIIEVDVPAAGAARWWLAWRQLDPGLSGWDGSHLEDLRLAGAIVSSAWARLELETDLIRRSRHDALTGLANRAELERRLQHLLDSGPATVLFCDLDGFKPVNDRFGHAFGDRVLAAVAGRLAAAVRPDDLLGRMGGDEFVAACPAMARGDEARAIARLQAALATPIRVDGTEVTLGVSIGAAAGAPGTDAAALIADADAAMYAAKATHRRPH